MFSVSDAKIKRRSRILGIQKKIMVSLIENYFIKTIGHHSNVNFEDIGLNTWQQFANILNGIGASKSANQWKTCFSNMTMRIRSKVEFVKQVDANPEDNLSELDMKIYKMFSQIGPIYNLMTVNDATDTLNKAIRDPPNVNNDQLPSNGYEIDSEIVDSEVDSSRILNACTAEKLDGLTNEPIIMRDVSPEVSPREAILIDNLCGESTKKRCITSKPKTSTKLATQSGNEGTNTVTKCSLCAVSPNNSLGWNYCQLCNRFLCDSCDIVYHNHPIRINHLRKSIPIANNLPIVNNIPISDQMENVKTSVNIPNIQKERLVQLVQNNFLKLVGRFSGVNGVHIKLRLWKSIADELNTLGPPRTAKQWKTTFDNLKSSVKCKLASDHNSDDKLSGRPLSRLEEKIVSIIGLDVLDGNQRLGEGGFEYRKTIPIVRGANNPKNESMTNAARNGNSQQTLSFIEDQPLVINNKNRDTNITMHDQSIQISSRGFGLDRSTDSQIRSSTITSGAYTAGTSRSLTNDVDEGRHGQNEFFDESEIAQDVSEEQSILREIIDEIWNETTERERPNATSLTRPSRNATVNVDQITDSRSTINRGVSSSKAANCVVRSDVQDRTSHRTVHAESNNSRSMYQFNSATGESVPSTRRRNSRFLQMIDDDESTFGNDRNDSRYRNKCTSFDMVERSMNSQERFIEQDSRNHSEMIFTHNRNHSENITMFTSALSTCANVFREYLNKN